MGRISYCAISIGILLAMASAAQATVGCAVVSDEVEAKSVKLYEAPDDGSAPLREVPLGDLVLYPDTELAPMQAQGWVWVRHDITQQAIWQSGIYGWMRVENIADCG